MPTYVYSCQDCGNQFESLRSMKDSDTPISCASCHSANTFRRLTTCNVKSNSADSGFNESNKSGCSDCQGGSCSNCGH
jgi:putative FmdB family regulatory protein